MVPGDLVRFDSVNVREDTGETLIGLLVKYNTWEKVATVLYEGKEFRIRASELNIHKTGPKGKRSKRWTISSKKN
tara:strand:+ start:2310 stop:2534 length:225 start_codon:yes stop_codon:yes gene_type:complete